MTILQVKTIMTLRRMAPTAAAISRAIRTLMAAGPVVSRIKLTLTDRTMIIATIMMTMITTTIMTMITTLVAKTLPQGTVRPRWMVHLPILATVTTANTRKNFVLHTNLPTIRKAAAAMVMVTGTDIAMGAGEKVGRGWLLFSV